MTQTVDIAYWEANRTALDNGPAFNIGDTAANIAGALNALNTDSNILQIRITDNTAVVFKVGQLINDTNVLSKLINDDNSAAHVNVRDTALHIANNFASIATEGQVSIITVSDNAAVVLSATQITSNTAALSLIHNADASPVNVTAKDSAAHIAADGTLDTIQAHLSIITSVVISNSTAMTLSASQIANDSGALAIVTNNNGNPVHFNVSDSGANISTYLDQLQANSQIVTITDNDNAAIQLNIAQFTSDSGALAKVVNGDASPVSFTVADSAANIAGDFDDLNTRPHVTKIIVTNSGSHEVTLSAATAVADTNAESLLFKANGTTPANVAVSDTAANISANFDALNGNSHVDSITITDANPLVLTVAQVTGDTTALGEIQGGYAINVNDTAAHISGGFDALSGNTNVTKIIVNDSAGHEVSITAAQAANDTVALGELFQSDGTTPANVRVTDTAANVSAAIDALNGNSHVDKIVVSDSATHEVAITAAQAAADSIALAELYLANGTTLAHVAVSDTAAHISGAIDALNANTHVDKIIVSDSATHKVTITVAQAAADSTVLGELYLADGTTPAHVAVSDTASNISGAFNALNSNAHVDKIIVSDSATHEVTITVAQAGSDATALGELFQSDGTTPAHVMVNDTAANISAAFDALNGNTHVDKIIVNDGPVGAPIVFNEVTISVTQAANDTTALGELYQTDGVTHAHVAVSDTAANISGAIDALNANTHVDKIIVSDSAGHEVSITAAQAGSDGTALGELFQSDGTTPAKVRVTDTAANISSAIDALNGNSHVDKIVVSDSATNEVTISVAQLTDTTALGELVKADGSTQANVAISDTAGNISTALNTLNGNSQVDKIIVNNSATHEVTANVAQLTSDATALAELFKADGVTHATVELVDTAANISAAFDSLNSNNQVDLIFITDNSNPLTLTVLQLTTDTKALGEIANATYIINIGDTAANISAAFDTLNNNANVTKIVVSDSATHEVAITAAQAGSDGTALGELFNSDGTTPANVAVQDTAANISSAFNALNANTHVDKIIVSNSGSAEVTITASQAATDTTALAELVQSDGSTPAQVAVKDTAAHIAAALNALNSNTHVDKIIVSNSGSAEVTISVAKAGADTAALGELFNSDGTTPAHVAVQDTAAHISAAFDTLSGNAQIDKIIVSNSGSAEVTISVLQAATDTMALNELKQSDGTTAAHVAVSDTAANISAAFNALNSNAHVDRIIVSDSGAHEVTISASQAASDTTALGELFQSDGTTAAHVAVQDTASAISGAFDALNGNAHVDKIIVSDSGSAEVTITVAQADSDTTALNELFQSDGLTAAHVAVQDTAADITAALDALNGNTHVDKIIVSDSGSHEVVVTVDQITTDATALAELKNVDGTTKANVTVSDTADNITGDLDNLDSNTQVNKIIVNDSASSEVVVNVAQITSDAAALAELFDANGTDHANVIVHDTAGNITGAFDALNINTQVNKIIVDNGPHHGPTPPLTEVTISVHQLETDTTALAELFQVDGVTQANVAVSDTAANISTALNELNGDSQVDHIIIADNGPITVTVAQALADSTALGELQNADLSPVTLEVNDVASAISANFDALNAISTISSIVISDNNPLNLTAVNIGTDSHALGILSNGDASGVEINVTDIAANISLYLDQLQANTDIISITVSDSAPITVTVAQINSDSVVLGELENADNSAIQLTVRDTASHIRQSLAALNQNVHNGEITSIVISNNLALNLTVTQYSNNGDALSVLHNANGNPYTLTISDNAAHISTALDALAGNTHITSITVTDSAAITLNIAQITNDATALGELSNANATPYTLSVHDTAADISAAFDALATNSHVVKIVVTDSATNEVTITATQVPHDPGALAELFEADGTTQAHVLVNDTAANISLWFGFLDLPQVDNIIVSDSASNEVVVSVSQITDDAVQLANLHDADTTTLASIVVQDTAADISAAFDSLNGNTQVNKIVVSDSNINEVVVSIAQISSDATALSELFKSDATTQAKIAVLDTAANITTALGSLNSNGQVNEIIVSDSNEVVVSVAQLTSDATALGELFNSDGVTHANVTVNDTAADIQAAFDALNSNVQVNKIVVSDSATSKVTLLAAQIHNDTAALGELFNANGTTSAHVLVVDTAAQISTYFNDLNSTQVSKITITDSSGHEVTITVAELTSDFHAIGVLFQSDGTTPAMVAVSDTAADISAGIGNLNANSHVDKIFISDGNPLTLTVAQVTNDTVALGRIQGPYQVSINDTAAHVSANLDALESNNSIISVVITDNKAVVVSVAQLTSDANVLSVMTDANNPDGAPLLRVVDTAAHIQAALGNLEADLFSDNFQSVVISDNAPISVSVAQVHVDGDVLFLLRNADGSNAQLTLSDTAAHVQNNIDFLQAFNGFVSVSSQHVFITSIVITNSQQMIFSAQQISDDAGVLGLVTNLNGGPVTFKVVDNAADITTYLDALQFNGEIATITVTDNGAIGVSIAQLSADASVLSKLHNQDNSAYKLVVTDTAADITAALATLHNNSHIEKVIVSDSGSGNEVRFSNFQLANDANVLNELFNANGTTHASVVLADSNAHLSAMTVSAIQNLASEHVNHIDSTTDAFTWNVAQYQALGSVTLDSGDNITLKDAASAFAALTVSGINALHSHGIDNVALTGSGTFGVAKWDALTEQGLSVTTGGAHITINGTNAADVIDTAGTGSFTLVGGKGADIFDINSAAHDTFVYNSGTESTSTGYDFIQGFNGANETIVSPNAITTFDGVLTHGTVNTATFDTDLQNTLNGHLGADGAIVLKVTSGSLSGHTFLVVDENGVAGYQSGDLVIEVTGGTHFASLTSASFQTLT